MILDPAKLYVLTISGELYGPNVYTTRAEAEGTAAAVQHSTGNAVQVIDLEHHLNKEPRMPKQDDPMADHRERMDFAEQAEQYDRDQAVLKMLEEADGAILGWQVATQSADFDDALSRGVIRFDEESDCYVHPHAVRNDDGSYDVPVEHRQAIDASEAPTIEGRIVELAQVIDVSEAPEWKPASVEPDEINELVGAYQQFCGRVGINLGSADEHLDDQRLTSKQRSWLLAYIALWEATESLDR